MLHLYGRGRLGKTFLLRRYFTAGVDGDEHDKPHCYFLADQSRWRRRGCLINT